MTLGYPTDFEIDEVVKSMVRSNQVVDIGTLAQRMPLPHGARSADLIFWKGIKPRLIHGPLVFCCDQDSILLGAAYSEDAESNEMFTVAAAPRSSELRGLAAEVFAPDIAIAKGRKFAGLNLILQFNARVLANCESIISAISDDVKCERYKIFTSGIYQDLEEFFDGLSFADGIKWFDAKTFEIELDARQVPEFLRGLAACAERNQLVLGGHCAWSEAVAMALQDLRNSLAKISVQIALDVDEAEVDPAMAAADICKKLISHPQLSFLHRLVPSLGHSPLQILGFLNEYFKGVARFAQSETLSATLDDRLPPNSVRPIAMLRWGCYDTYYRFRGRELMHYGMPPHSKDPYVLRFGPDEAGAGARLLLATALVEYVLAMLGQQYPNEPIRWLDMGCGGGQIMNLVKPDRVGVNDFEFVGVDSAEGEIEWARRTAGSNRTFHTGNAFALPAEVPRGGFHLVTMFEFIEHVDDPIGLIRAAADLSTAYVLGGSPCDEPMPNLASTAHLWSFTKEGFVEVFRQAGLDIALANQTDVGRYRGGLDWLSCLGSKKPKVGARCVAA